MGVACCLCEAKMLLIIVLLNFMLCLITGVDAHSTQKSGLEGLENLEQKLESRLRDMETRMEVRMDYEEERNAKEKKELEAKIKELEARVDELEDEIKEEKEKSEKRESGSVSKTEAEGSFRKDISSNNIAPVKPSLRDLPIVLISAYQSHEVYSSQTVTFESFLANYNNADRPGGGGGVLDLDSGIFTCITPGYYTVSFSVFGHVENLREYILVYLYKNAIKVQGSSYWLRAPASDDIGVTGARILIIHMDEGDTLELRLEMIGSSGSSDYS